MNERESESEQWVRSGRTGFTFILLVPWQRGWLRWITSQALATLSRPPFVVSGGEVDIADWPWSTSSSSSTTTTTTILCCLLHLRVVVVYVFVFVFDFVLCFCCTSLRISLDSLHPEVRRHRTCLFCWYPRHTTEVDTPYSACINHCLPAWRGATLCPHQTRFVLLPLPTAIWRAGLLGQRASRGTLADEITTKFIHGFIHLFIFANTPPPKFCLALQLPTFLATWRSPLL